MTPLLLLLNVVTLPVSPAKDTPSWKPQEMFQFPPPFLQDLDFAEWAPCPGNKVKDACKCRDTRAMCTMNQDMCTDGKMAPFHLPWPNVYSPPVYTAPSLLTVENISTLYFYNDLTSRPSWDGSPIRIFPVDGKWPHFFEPVDGISTLYIGSRKAELSDVGVNLVNGIVNYFTALEILYLDLSPELNKIKLQELLRSRTLRELYLSDTTLILPSNEGLFDKVKNLFQTPGPVQANLRILSFSDCQQMEVDMTVLKTLLKHLLILHFTRTHISEIKYDCLEKLQYLSITKDNRMSQFLQTCTSESESYFPSLVYLILDENAIRKLSQTFCLPSLRYISLNGNPFPVIKQGQFNSYFFPRLAWLSLKHMYHLKLENMAFANPELQSIDLSDSDIDLASNSVSPDVFTGCSGLTQVNLEGNNLRDISIQKLRRLFMSLRSVNVLNLKRTHFPPVREATFELLKRITHLILSDNGITTIRDNSFSGFDNLTVLQLDNNFITTLREEAFGSDTLARLTTLNLSGNRFECTCSLVWLHQRLWSNPAMFDVTNPYSHYSCDNMPDTLVTDAFVNIQQCLLSHEAYVFTVVCSAILLFTLTSAMLLYRYRWHILLAFSEGHRGNPQAKWHHRRPEEFQFDIFVSYDSEDARWVHDHLMPTLEEGYGLRLCVHQRDFIPGKNITDNIEDCLATSKRVLAIFSPNFAESRWCQFELEMCLSHVVDNDDVMVVVILQHVPARDLTGAMIALLRTTTYIEWGEETDAQDCFWRRLTIALNDILPGGRQ